MMSKRQSLLPCWWSSSKAETIPSREPPIICVWGQVNTASVLRASRATPQQPTIGGLSMNTHLFAPVIFGLAASLCWGSGDFSGGLASRRANVGSVVLTDYVVGFVLLVMLALLWKEPFPEPLDLLWGGLAGVAGVLGLLAF